MAHTSSLNLNAQASGPSNLLHQIPVMMTASGSQLLINNKPDVSQVAQSDPSLMGGYRLVFDRKCPFSLHVVHPDLIEKVGHTI